MTFYGLAALGGKELEAIADAMQSIRGGRHTALYGDEEELEPEDLQNARAVVGHCWQRFGVSSSRRGLHSPRV